MYMNSNLITLLIAMIIPANMYCMELKATDVASADRIREAMAQADQRNEGTPRVLYSTASGTFTSATLTPTNMVEELQKLDNKFREANDKITGNSTNIEIMRKEMKELRETQQELIVMMRQILEANQKNSTLISLSPAIEKTSGNLGITDKQPAHPIISSSIFYPTLTIGVAAIGVATTYLIKWTHKAAVNFHK